MLIIEKHTECLIPIRQVNYFHLTIGFDLDPEVAGVRCVFFFGEI